MRGRPSLVIPTRELRAAVPLDVFTKLALELHSELEGRVPYAAYSKFITQLLRAHFESTELDLAPFLGSDPGAFVVSAPSTTIAALLRTLKGEVPLGQ